MGIEQEMPKVSLEDEIKKAEAAGDIKRVEELKKKAEEATKEVRFNWLQKLMGKEKEIKE